MFLTNITVKTAHFYNITITQVTEPNVGNFEILNVYTDTFGLADHFVNPLPLGAGGGRGAYLFQTHLAGWA